MRRYKITMEDGREFIIDAYSQSAAERKVMMITYYRSKIFFTTEIGRY